MRRIISGFAVALVTTAGFLTFTAAPAAAAGGTTIDSSPASPMTVGSSPVDATWTITTPTSAQCQLVDTDSSSVVDGPDSCSSGSVTFPVAAPGNYQLAVLPDSDAEVDSSTLVAAPPAPSIDSTPTSPFNDPTPRWTFTLEAGATATCEIDHPAGTAIQAQSNCSSPFTADDLNASSTNGDPGHYTLSVVQTVNGVDSDPATSDYDFETAKPATPSVSADKATGFGLHPSFTVTGLDPDATPTCTVTPAANASVNDCGASPTLDLSTAPDGDYTLHVFQTYAGNDSDEGTATYALDTHTPNTPTISADAQFGSSAAPSFTVGNVDGDAQLECSVSGPSNVTVTSCDTTTVLDLTGADAGRYVVTVDAKDTAGKSGPSASAHYEYLPTAPAAPTVRAADAAGSGTSPSFTISDSENATLTYDCTVTAASSDASLTVPAPTCGPNTTLDLSSAPDDTYTLSVTATDQLGQVSDAGSDTYTLDTSTPNPNVTLSNPASSPSANTDPSFTIGDAETTDGPDTFTCEWDAPDGTTISNGACATGDDFPTAGHGNGRYTLTVTASDTVGNTNTAAPVGYVLEAAAPPAPTVSVDGNPVGSSPTASFTVADAENVPLTYACLVVGHPGSVVTCGPTTTIDLGSVSDGTYTLRVTVTDELSQISPAGTADYTLDTAAQAPTVALMAPDVSPSTNTSPQFTIIDNQVVGGPDTFTCTWSGPGISVAIPQACASGDSFPAGSDGDYTLSVTSTDGAGNTSPTAGTATYSLDTTAPAAPTVVLGTPASSPGKAKVPTFTVSNPGDVSPGGLTYACTVTETSVIPNVTLPPSRTTCGPTTTVHLAPTGDGDYTLSVTATDASGNTSAFAGTASYTLDSAVPAAPTVALATPASSPGHATTPTFTVTDTDTSPGGLTYSCVMTEASVTPNVTVPASDVTCGPTTSVDLRGTGDGDYTLAVTATDAAGNVSTTSGTASYTLDATAPAAPTVTLISPASSPADVTAPEFSVTNPGDTSPGGLTYACTVTETSVTPNITLPGSDVTCDATTTVNLGATGDGGYTLAVVATDASGNSSGSGTVSYTLDTSAPSAPAVTLSDPASTPGNDTSPQFTVSNPGDVSPGGLTYSCTVTKTSVVPNLTLPASDVTCGSSTTLDLGSAGDGDYTIAVTATDAAGNVSATAGSASYTLDTAPPATPIVTLSVPSTSPGHSTVPQFSVSDPGDTSPGGLTYSCNATGPSTVVPGSDITCGPTTTVDLSALPDATYTLAVTATDAAGNASAVAGTATYTIDTAAPAAPTVVLTSPASSPGDSTTPQFAVSDPGDTSPGGLTYSCSATETSTTPAVNVPAGRITCGPTTTLHLGSFADGDFTVSVTATDAAGNSSVTAGTATYTMDTSLPASPDVTLASPSASPGSATSLVFDVTDPDGSPGGITLSCNVTGPTTVPASDIACGSTTTVDLSGASRDGSYTLAVTATDAAGNSSAAPGTATYLLDTTAPGAPTVTLLSPAASPGNVTSPEFSVTNPGDTSPGGLTYACAVTETSVTPNVTLPGSAVTCGPTTTVDLNATGDGDYTLAVTATDAAGNSGVAGSVSYTLDTTAPAAPAVTLLSPTTSPGNDTSPSFTVSDAGDTSPGGLTFSCVVTETSVTPNVTVPGSDVACGSTTIVDLASSGDGHYRLDVIATDAAGNASSVGSASYTLDATVPDAPTVVLESPASSPGNTTTAVFNVTNPGDVSPGGLTYACTVTETSVTPNLTVPASDVTCGPTTTVDVSGTGDGAYALDVTATDAAGNMSVAGSGSYTLDTVVPDAPTVDLAVPASSPGHVTSPQFTVSNPGDVSPGGLTYACTVTETSVTPNVTVPGSDVTCGATTTVDLSGTGDGDYTLSVTATDAAGNTSVFSGSATYTLDTQVPMAPVVTLATPAGSPGNEATPTFTVSDTGDTSPGGLTFSCVVTETSVTPNVTVPTSAVTCGPTTTVDLSGTGDGDYTLAVTATDAAGNASASGIASYTLDTAVPADPTVTLISPAGSPGNVTSPVFSLTNPGDVSPGGLTYACTVTETSVTPSVTVPDAEVTCGSTTVVDLGTSGDGDYTLAVTATDAAGNTSVSSGSATYTLDTQVPAAPAVTLLSPTTSPGNEATPTFTVSDTGDTSPGGLTFSCVVTETSVTPNVTVPTSAVTCGPTTTVDLTGAGDGHYRLDVTATDAAGNVSAAGTASYTLDATAPAAPSVTLLSPATSPGNVSSPQFSVTNPGDASPGGLTYTCVVTETSVTPNVTVSASAVTCGPTTTVDLSGTGDGDYTLSVTVTDAAGNSGPAPGTASYTLDTAVPDAPTVVLATPASSPGHRTSPQFTVSNPGDVSPGGLTYACTVTETSVTPNVTVPVSDVTCGPTTIVDLSGTGDGAYTLAVTATDAAGNQSTSGIAFYTLDATAPTAPTVTLISPASSPGNVTSPVYSVTNPGDVSPGGLTYSCVVTEISATPNVTVPGSDVTCGATTTIDLGTTGDGTYTLAVTATDAAGNASPSAGSATYTLDRTAPPAPGIIAPAPSTKTPTFVITDGDATATLSCLLVSPHNRTVFPTGSQTTCPANGTFDTSAFTDGDYTLTVTATDPAGNATSSTVVWMRDTTPPPAPTVVAPASPSNNRSPVFTIADGEAGATLSCRLTGPDSSGLIAFSGTCPAGGQIPIAGNDGVYTLTVSATDAAGNTNLSTASATYTLDTTAPRMPTVIRVSPLSSPASVTTARFSVTDPDSSPGGVTLHCEVTGPATVPATDVSCGATTSVDLSSTGDGTYTLSVTATDAAHNVSPVGTATYTLDTTPPPAPAVVLATPVSSPGHLVSPIFFVTDADTSAGVTFSCAVTGATTVPASAVSCGPTTTVDLGGSDRDGSYTLSVTATDAAGNTSTTAGTATYTLDTIPPDQPIVSLASATRSNSKNPLWTWQFGLNDPSTAQETATCTITGPHGWTSVVPNCGHRLHPSLDGGDGDYIVTVTVTDEAGNTASNVSPTYTLDSTAPAGPTVVLRHPTTLAGRDRHPVWRVTGPASSTLLCTLLQGGESGTPLGPQQECPDPATYSLVGLPDGMYTLKVVAVDSAHNPSSAASASYVLSPAAPQVDAPNGRGPVAVWSVTGNPADKLSCTLLRGGVAVSGPRQCGSHPTYDMSARPAGTYTLSVVQVGPQSAQSAPGTAHWFWRGSQSPNPPGSPGSSGTGPGPGPGNQSPANRGPHGLNHVGGTLAGLPGQVQRIVRVAHGLKNVVAPFVPNVHPNRIADDVSSAVQGVVHAVGAAGGGTGFPLLLVGLVFAFLVAQNRIDRRDPKLALASIAADDMVEFQLPPSRRRERP